MCFKCYFLLLSYKCIYFSFFLSKLFNLFSQFSSFFAPLLFPALLLFLPPPLFFRHFRMLFSAATDKLGAVWDVEVGARVKKLKGHSSYVNSVASSQRGSQVIATGSDDGTARVRLLYMCSFC